MELRQYAAVVWRWLWLMALAALVAGAAAFYVSQQMTPIYRASTTLLISQAENPGTPDYNSILTGERLARTYSQLLEKRPVLESTIEQLRLPYTATQLAEIVSAQVVRDTQLIELAVEHPDPDKAAQIANTLAATFIAQTREDALGQTATYRESLQKQLADIEAAMKQTSQRIEQLRAQRAQDTEVLYLQGVLTQYQSTYAQLLKADQDMRLAEAKTANTVRVAEPAEPPVYPVRPNVWLNTLLAALVGLLLASGVVFLYEYLDDTVKAPADVEHAVGLPTLGNIIRFPRNGHPERLVTERDPRSPVAEAYRVLRTSVDFARVSHPGSTLLVTSSLQREGKTTTAANLAAITALAGRSVILVDADLRRPNIHKLFGLENADGAGLTGVLVGGQVEVERALRPTAVYGLRILPSGPIPPNPAELLASARMGEVIQQLKALADVVIFDSPPLLAVSDPVILGSQLEGALLVVDAGHTRHGELARAVDALERAAVPILGVVLNKLSRRTSGGYYYYRYYGSRREKGDHETAAQTG